MFYYSKSLTNAQQFVEFFFEIMHEKPEPLIAVIEFAKCILRLREYALLVGSERVNAYIDADQYQEMKRLKEIRDQHFTLVRSKKRLPKIKTFKFSEKLEALKKQNSAPIAAEE